jgi:hypothetical protein
VGSCYFFCVSFPYHDRAHRKYCCNTGYFCASFSVIERVREAFLIVSKTIFNVTEASRMFGGKFGCVKRFNTIDTVLKVDCCVFGSTKYFQDVVCSSCSNYINSYKSHVYGQNRRSSASIIPRRRPRSFSLPAREQPWLHRASSHGSTTWKQAFSRRRCWQLAISCSGTPATCLPWLHLTSCRKLVSIV